MTTPQSRLSCRQTTCVTAFGIGSRRFSDLKRDRFLVRFAQGKCSPSLVIAAWRLTFAALILLPFCFSAPARRVAILEFGRYAVCCIVRHDAFLHFATWITSLEYVGRRFPLCW